MAAGTTFRRAGNVVARGYPACMDISRVLGARAGAVQESVIRRVFEGARDVVNPINFSIGQPDFAVPEAIKGAAVRAIERDQNGYAPNRGVDPLLARIARHLKEDVGWEVTWPGSARTLTSQSRGQRHGDVGVMVTQGTSGGLIAAAMAVLDPGDEIIIPDPYFVLYPRLAELTGARAVPCDTYPDFRMTAARVEPLITARTKAVLLVSPSNPCGVVASEVECRELLELCRRKNVLLISDEIYDEFTYPESRTAKRVGSGQAVAASPARFPGAEEDVLLVRGFGKTYGCTGWRLGYVAGPAALINAMVKMQQHLYICAPTPLQHGVVEAFDTDMGPVLESFRRRRDMVVERLKIVTEVPYPGGAFYAFVKVPERLGMTAEEFMKAARAKRVLIVPGYAFSKRDTHFRISYAVRDEVLDEGLEIIAELMKA
jgi:aspartate/methionine/tyrosine aminotransferase